MKMEKDKKPTCGQCGYFMRYIKSEGVPDHDGDCGCIDMNIECMGYNPFTNDDTILQVDESEIACKLFKRNIPKRVKEYIKKYPKIYSQKKVKQ